MKVLIIGCGAISEMFHIPAAIKLLGIENVFVVETSIEQLYKIQTKFNLSHCSDDMSAFIEEIDFCIVATPPHTHLNILKKCLEFKKPVLCEKPITLNYSESKELIELQKNSGVLIALCHSYRFFPNRNYIRKQIQDGYFGENIGIEIEEGEPASWQSVSGYNFRKELVPGGVLLDAGIHSLDFLLWCLGKPISYSYQDDSLGGLESNCELHLEFKNGGKACFKLSRTHNFLNSIKVKGSLNQSELPIFEMTKVIENSSTEKLIDSEVLVDWSNLAEVQLQNFIDSLHNQDQVKCDLLAGTDLIEIIEAFYQLKKQRPMPKIALLPGELF